MKQSPFTGEFDRNTSNSLYKRYLSGQIEPSRLLASTCGPTKCFNRFSRLRIDEKQLPYELHAKILRSVLWGHQNIDFQAIKTCILLQNQLEIDPSRLLASTCGRAKCFYWFRRLRIDEKQLSYKLHAKSRSHEASTSKFLFQKVILPNDTDCSLGMLPIILPVAYNKFKNTKDQNVLFD